MDKLIFPKWVAMQHKCLNLTRQQMGEEQNTMNTIQNKEG